jgi:hypothetical protein
MPSQNFQDYNQNNPVTSTWLNGVNKFIFGLLGNNAQTSPLAWVRFNGTTGAIVQSYGVASVVRNGLGNYTVTFAQTLAQATNVYSISQNVLGMNGTIAETTNSVTFQTANTAGANVDPTAVSITVFGAYTPSF